MNILITGICGFLGSNLSRALIERGHTVYGIDDLSVGKEEYLPTKIREFLQMNVANMVRGVGFDEGYDNIDMIIHLATRKIPREGNADVVLVENVAGMMNVVGLAKRLKARVIFMSTSDIYGKQPLTGRYETEDTDSIIGCPDVSRWSYAVSKMWCEQYLFSHPDLRFNIIRLYATYGEYSSMTWRAGPIPVFINQALRGLPISIHGTGQQTRCFMYVDDAVNGIIKVVDRDDLDRQVFNIADPSSPISINSLALMIWNMVNNNTDLLKEMQEHIPGVKYEEVERRLPCIKKANKVLGFQPTVPLEKGLSKTIKWQQHEISICPDPDCRGNINECGCIPF